MGSVLTNIACRKKKKIEKRAISDYNLAVAFDPDSAMVWLNRAIARSHKGDHDSTEKMDEDAFTIRADSQPTPRKLLTARYSYDDQRQFFPFDIFFISAPLPAFPFPNPERRQSLALSYTQTFGDNLVNEARFGLNRQRNPIPSGATIDPASIGLPSGAPQNEFGRGLPIIRVTGFGGAGGQPLTDNLGASTTARNLFQYKEAELRRLAEGNEATRWLYQPAADWLKKWRRDLRLDGFNLFDTLAIGYLTSPQLTRWEELQAEIRVLPDDVKRAKQPGGKAEEKPYLLLGEEGKVKWKVRYCFDVAPEFKEDLMARLLR